MDKVINSSYMEHVQQLSYDSQGYGGVMMMMKISISMVFIFIANLMLIQGAKNVVNVV
jgi:TATA-box binding protein (TBP) (component of TFIID and TFIIIB)